MEPKEGKDPIKKADAERLDTIIRSQGTKSVQIANVKLLCDASGTEISALEPGGGDVSPLSTPLAFKSHIANVFMKLSPDASLIRIPPVALLKLVTLRWSTADLFFLEHFGHMVWKDPVIVPIGESKHSATFGDMMVMPATKDLWA